MALLVTLLLFLLIFNIGKTEHITVLIKMGNQELDFEDIGQSRINFYNLPEKLKDNGTQNLCKGTNFIFCCMRTKGQGQILWRLQGGN